MTARSGPHQGSVPALAVLPGAGVGVALLGAEERAGGPEILTPFLSLLARSLADSGIQGLLRPSGPCLLRDCHHRGVRVGVPLHNTQSQAASLYPGLILGPRGDPFGFSGTRPFQCPTPRCSVDSGCLISMSWIGSRGMPGTGRGVGWGCGGGSQVGWGSGLEFGFFL